MQVRVIVKKVDIYEIVVSAKDAAEARANVQEVIDAEDLNPLDINKDSGWTDIIALEDADTGAPLQEDEHEFPGDWHVTELTDSE